MLAGIYLGFILFFLRFWTDGYRLAGVSMFGNQVCDDFSQLGLLRLFVRWPRWFQDRLIESFVQTVHVFFVFFLYWLMKRAFIVILYIITRQRQRKVTFIFQTAFFSDTHCHLNIVTISFYYPFLTLIVFFEVLANVTVQ